MRWMSRGLLACGLVSMLLHGRGLGEPIRSWGELRAREKRRAGIFGQWSPDPAKVERALRLLERRRQGKLSEGIEGQLAGTTRDVSDMELLARSYLREGRVALARTQLGKIIEKDPASRGGRLLLAEIYERCGRDGLAVAELEELARLRREELGARRRLAALYTRTRRMADAVRVLKDLVRMQPDDLGVQRQLVRALAHAGDYPVAKAAADALLRADPEGIETRLILAECYRVFRQPDEARKVLETLDKEHARADVAEALARVLLGLQDAKAADRVLAPWLDKADVKPLLLAAAAVAAQGSGNVEKASSLCYRLRAGGLASLATDILANVWVGRRDAAAVRAVADAVPGPQRARMEAYTALLQAVSRAPADAQRAALLLNVATVLRLAGWSEESTDLLSIAGRIAPDTALIGSRLARARAAAGWQEGAVALWEKLVGDFPDSKPLAVDYAQALRRGRELEKAASICREAMKKPGDNTELRLLLSDIAAQQGRYEAAISAVAPMLGKDAAHADAYVRTVTARLVLGELAAIDRAFTERRIVEPGYLPGALERIVRLAQREKQASAIAQAEHTLAQAPFEWRWQFLAGLLYERAGRWAEAAEAFDAVRMIRPALLASRLHRARLAVRLDELDLAKALVAEIAKEAPDVVQPQIEFANLLLRIGRPDEAAAHLSTLAPTRAEARHDVQARLAGIRLRLGQRAEAATLAEKVLAEDARHAQARAVAATAYRLLGDIQGALAMYGRLLTAERKPDVDEELGILLLLRGGERVPEAARRLGRALENADADRRHIVLLCVSAARLGLDDAAKARAAAVGALEARPKGAPPSVELYMLLAVTGETERARKELAVVRRARPEVAEWIEKAGESVRQRAPKFAAPFVVGFLASRFGWMRGGAQLFEVVRKANPKEPAVLYATATAELTAGRREKARESADALIEIRPKSGRAHMLLGRVLADQGRPAEAKEALGKAAGLIKQDSIPLWLELARRLADVGSVDGAIEAYRRILELEPDSARAANNLAWLYCTERPDRLREAERLATRAVELDPKSASALDTLAWVLFVSGRHGDAERHVRRALELGAPRPAYHYHLGMIAYRREKLDVARQALDQALEMGLRAADADTARATLKLMAKTKPKD